MTRRGTYSLAGAGIAAAMVLMAAVQPLALAQALPGVWEVSGVPGTSTPIRQCVAELSALARFEHRLKNCSAKVLKEANGSTAVEYSCGSAGFGHSQIDVLTPRSLRISTQGISDGLPFNYVLQAHRVSDCEKSASVARH